MHSEASTLTNIELDKERLLGLYTTMLTIREFEEAAQDLYTRTLIPGLLHISVGQEAVAVGVCAAIRESDYITSTHRGHGHCIAKGADVGRMFAELFGKADGYCRGKGGSMHIANPDVGNLGANAIVGGSIPIATGAALSAQLRGTGQLAVCFFGDGALNQGVFSESLNYAALWKLPIIYACENNGYGEYTATKAVTAGKITDRGEAFGVPSSNVDGMDVLEVYRATCAATERARNGDGPSFISFATYRYYGHGMSDRDRAYRTRDEEKEWRQLRDPIDRYAAWLLARHQVTQEELDRMQASVKMRIKEGVEFGKAAPYPDPSEVMKHVYSA
jgi:acetoin:2,6-dichlorophenolindophenol oxidoreductase subunit alpha